MEKINILLLNDTPDSENAVSGFLDADIFNVSRIDNMNAGTGLSGFTPQLIIYKTPKDIRKAGIDDDLKKFNPDDSIPVLFITDPETSESYLLNLCSGIYHHVNLPLNKEFLYSKLFGILNKHIKTNEGLCNLEIEYNRISKNLNITNYELSAFIVSAMENSVLCNKSSNNDLKSKGTFKQNEESCAGKDKYLVERELSLAIERNEFVLHYQPIMSLKDNILSGFEALVRWNHPEKGLIFPDDFIPVLENSPLIIPAGFIIIENAAKQLKEWQKKFDARIRMSINLSPRQFVHEPLCERIFKIIDSYALHHEDITFEVTETAFTEDMETANITLLKLRSQKFKINLDDFGTGYSSMMYLVHFPVDSIKIDKSFVKWMNVDETSEQIVKSVIFLAHNLNMKIIAEGVETSEHLAKLTEYGADFLQGYYYAKPLAPEKAEEYIEKFYKKVSSHQSSI
ncbi:MAG: EAL domain-containing protein [Spirochaetota bacterium]